MATRYLNPPSLTQSNPPNNPKLEFRICPIFTKKPHTIGAKLDRTFATTGETIWGPGSDLYCPDPRMKIAVLNQTHDLAFNMFCVDRPQFLLLTLDSWRRQDELLDGDDFEAALQMLRIPGLGDELYVIFNGGREAGCSRVHKHLQGLRGPPPAFGNFVEEGLRGTVPFKYFAHRFEEGFEGVTGKRVVEVYLKLIREAKNALGIEQSEKRCPHGLFMWKDWLVVIPRRKAGVEGTKASAATAGMLGSAWLSEDSPVDDWERLGYRNVLMELGVPP